MSTSEQIDCPVCYEPESEWQGSTKAKCGHAMCMQCFLEWTVEKHNMSCPICRGNVRVAKAQPAQPPQSAHWQPQPIPQWLQSALQNRPRPSRQSRRERLQEAWEDATEEERARAHPH